MQFFLGSKLDKLLYVIKPHHRYLLTLATLCCLCCIWLMCIYFPIRSKINSTTMHVQKINGQIALMGKSKAQCTQLDTLITTLQNDFKKKRGARSADDTFSQALLFVINNAGKTGLAMNSCVVADAADKKWYIKQSADIQMQGKFSQILQFFTELEKSEFMIAPRHLNLTNNNDIFTAKCTLNFMIIK